eukprot:CAMPEP_0168705852 /NCGR_PEP_ID=MMETSP0503-20121227/40291_1 /TAXON_ID=89963 /ORGANISM="Heterocapsa rotundata, Strain SCCAP K-0483" /LENGTH=50 /DNA_ID=CAMNT_0008752077 /DNA_START=101 /DNA_END=250 /DNA_ORIENTATION=-
MSIVTGFSSSSASGAARVLTNFSLKEALLAIFWPSLGAASLEAVGAMSGL